VRCSLQIFEIRDIAIQNKDNKDRFDEIYEPILDNLLQAYTTKEDLRNTINKFADDFNKELNYKKVGNSFQIEEDIDLKINNLFSNFIIKLHTSVKNIQKIFEIFNQDIWFFYQKETSYIKGKNNFKHIKKKEEFINMLDNDRIRYEKLANIRNSYNHDDKGFKLDLIKYDFNKKIIIVPWEIADMEILWENSWKFIEDIIMILFESLLPRMLTIVAIPKEEREKDKPIKYKITIKENILPPSI
jgi:hypothetical protein